MGCLRALVGPWDNHSGFSGPTLADEVIERAANFRCWPTTEVYGNAGYFSLLRSTETGARQAAR